MATFPAIPVSKKSKPRTQTNADVIQFGDGYEQVVIRGINSKRQIWDVVFDNISFDDWDTIKTFLADKVENVFDWTPPTESSPRKWRLVADSEDPNFTGHKRVTVKYTFRESFELS